MVSGPKRLTPVDWRLFPASETGAGNWPVCHQLNEVYYIVNRAKTYFFHDRDVTDDVFCLNTRILYKRETP